MFWIVTFDATLTDEELVVCLSQAGGTPPDTLNRIPLGDTEASIEVEADSQTADRLRQQPKVHGVYPSSQLSLY